MKMLRTEIFYHFSHFPLLEDGQLKKYALNVGLVFLLLHYLNQIFLFIQRKLISDDICHIPQTL